MHDKMETYTIYKISCKDETIQDCYIGSTKEFHKRSLNHKNMHNKSWNKAYYSSLQTCIRENGGWDNWKIEIIDTIECYFFEKNGREKEQYWIDTLNPSLNIKTAFLTDNKKQFYNTEIICECGSKYLQKNHKQHLKSLKHYRYIQNQSSS